MPSYKKPVSFFLLFVFAILILKSAFGATGASGINDCFEFGHIHAYSWGNNLDPNEQGRGHEQEHEQEQEHKYCHEGKNIASILFPRPPLWDQWISQIYFKHTMIFKIQNFFLSPEIEPHRKPPKRV